MEIQKSVRVGFAIASVLLVISVIGLFVAKRMEIEAADRPQVQRVYSDEQALPAPRPVPIYRIGE